jgi:hypothetical protein
VRETAFGPVRDGGRVGGRDRGQDEFGRLVELWHACSIRDRWVLAPGRIVSAGREGGEDLERATIGVRRRYGVSDGDRGARAVERVQGLNRYRHEVAGAWRGGRVETGRAASAPGL